eukprot:COSAG05_NODE_3548_length_1998_cov_1.643497_3_plen_28_part_01
MAHLRQVEGAAAVGVELPELLSRALQLL